MLIEGLVTDVNEKMLTFEVNKITIHLVLLFAEEIMQKLPQKGTSITVESRHEASDRFLILSSKKNKIVKGTFTHTVDREKNIFLKIVKDLNLGESHLTEIARNFERLKKHFIPPHDITCEELIEKVTLSVFSDVFQKFELELVSQIMYVSDECNEYKDFIYWTPGHHWNWPRRNVNKYLIGYLFVFGETGTFYFTDFKRHVPCIVTNIANEDIFKYPNSYILVKDYVFLTEIINCEKLRCLECVMFDLSQVTKFNSERLAGRKEASPEFAEYRKTSFRIISKSLPIAGARASLYCWLQIIQEEKLQSYLCLTSSYFHYFPLLQPGLTYDFYYKNTPKSTFNKEIRQLNPSPLLQNELGPGGHIINTSLLKNPATILDVATALSKVNTSSEMISFEGVISLKKFVNPLGSRTARVTNSPHFGTPGFKTHLLEFKTEDNRTLTVYLNNWENMAIPYGLIPDMRVIVHNVKPQSRRYYKSTTMTRIEVVRFEPKSRFDTADLCSFDWGLPYFLGAGSDVPTGAIIWTKVCNLFVLSLKINVDSDSKEKIKLNASITIVTDDLMGESKVIAKEKSGLILLKALLGVQDKVFEEWCQGVEVLGTYNYFKGKDQNSMPRETGEKAVAIQCLDRYFDVIAELGLQLDLKCRKMNEDGGKPLYFLIDARQA